jgi:hypothetical protein
MSVIYIVLFVGIGVILSMYVLNIIFKHTNAYHNQFVDIIKFYSISKEPNHSIDVVNLGSNAPKFDFDYSDVNNLKGENWAVGPETFEYDLILLRKFSEKLHKGSTVILPICPGKFFLSKFTTMDNIVKYYSLLKPEEIPDYDKKQYICDYKYPLLFHPGNLKRILRDVKKDNRLALDYNPMECVDVSRDACLWIERCWNPEFGIDIENMKPLSEKNRRAVEFNIEQVREICRFCKEQNLNLILSYLPLTKELGDKFSSEYIKTQMTDYVEDATRGYNVPLVDYMKDSRFNHYQYYINSFFMNRIGAKKFTKIFIEENILNKNKI